MTRLKFRVVGVNVKRSLNEDMRRVIDKASYVSCVQDGESNLRMHAFLMSLLLI